MTVDIINHLSELGFTDYEAKAYTALVKRSPLTGYELAKVSGVPRPNVYPVIERLQQKGAILSVGIEGGVKYAPVPPEELLSKLSRSYQSHIQDASILLNQIQSSPQADYIWHLQGYSNILDKSSELISNARKQILIGLWPAELQLLTPRLQKSKIQGINNTILSFQGNDGEVSEDIGMVYKLRFAKEKHNRWFVVVVDEVELLTAEISPNTETQGAWTRQKLLVDMATWYMRHSIAVAEIVRSLGPRIRDLLDKKALSAIEGVSLSSLDGQPWLQNLLQTIDMEKI